MLRRADQEHTLRLQPRARIPLPGPACRPHSVLVQWLILLLALVDTCLPADQATAGVEAPQLYLSASKLLKFGESFGSTAASDKTFDEVVRLSYRSIHPMLNDLTAFEEGLSFVYALGEASTAPGGSPDRLPKNRLRQNYRVVRRLVFLKPSTFVLDEEITAAPDALRWTLHSSDSPKVSGQLAQAVEADGELVCETLLPRAVTRKIRFEKGDQGREAHWLDVIPKEPTHSVRFLHVLHTRRLGDTHSVARSEMLNQEGRIGLRIETKEYLFRLSLPSPSVGAGEIEISRPDGKLLLARRLLPSGKLPHGVKGVRLLDQWDADYRRNQPPLWDAGRPSSELTKAVETGTIRPGRVVELGCGSGTDAVYLAGRGFDVTAIDIAPTALRLAQEKALQAGVRVRWLLADVLALPSLGAFDFVYDRGCYHEVRDHNLKGYLDSVDLLSRPGTQFLLLAGNANESLVTFGPPRVTEEELRSDFSALFDFEWLRESRFEIARPSAMGPLAWSALLSRKAKP